MKFACAAIAVAAALGVAAVGVLRGTYAAGGSDSSCYAMMADAFASGALQPSSNLVERVPWPDASKTFTPGGFVASESNPSASSPVCAPGFSLLLAPLIVAGGRDAIFILTPIAGAVLVWLTFIAGRTIGGPIAGAMAAALVATSPSLLYQVVQPMNDVTTAALWMATVAALLGRRYVLAGLCCGLALLVRPNLLPLALICALAIVIRPAVARQRFGEVRRSLGGGGDQGLGIRNVARFLAATIPFALLVLWLNSQLYGSPFRTGYGATGQLFSLDVLPINASRYFTWLLETHTPFPLLAFAAPFVVAREKRLDALLAMSLIAATCFIYFIYTPFDEWTYLRFLLPAIALMLVLVSAASFEIFKRVFPRRPGVSALIIMGFTAAMAILYVRTAEDRLAFKLKFLEQRYRSAGIVVRDRLPEGAVVLSVWDSGAVRFHGRKDTVVWAGLDPAWLDRAVRWLDEHGRTPYILVESWEEPAFRNRFAGHSDTGKLDWPPRYEIDRVVRIFDPKDRAKYHRGESVVTEYLWPMRK